MHGFMSLRGLLFGALLFVGSLACGTGAARACDPPPRTSYVWVVCYEWVTTCETRQEPYTKVIILHDECGRSYTATVTCYRAVQVEVKKKVPVKKKVLVRY